LIAVVIAALAVAPPRPPSGEAAHGPSPEDAETHTDLAYGPHGRHRLDLYLPAGPGPHPLVVLIHGGGHVVGDKSSFGLQLLLPFASRAGP
jgi:acetyl esterase/lipase